MSTSKHLLLAAAVLATLLVSETAENFAFYKLSLQWPPTTCKFAACKTPVLDYFTIHGFWPQYADDVEVPPYNTSNPCNVRPTRPSEIEPLLMPIRDQLDQLWPDLYINHSNSDFWRYQWKKHGMCSDYPKKPKEYFRDALTLAGNYKPLDVIGIQAGLQTTVGLVLGNVSQRLGKYPQIACKHTPPQLWEVRFCFDRATPPSSLRDCPNRTSGTCKRKSDTISLPAAPVPDELNIIRQVVSV